MMAIFHQYLTQGASDSYVDCLWYLDKGASSHMIGKKSFFNQIYENRKKGEIQ